MKDKIKEILLDIGHGGSDPGAIGGGLREKDIVLEIGRHVKWYLENNYTCSVKMTRTGDETLSLKRRTDIENNIKPDLFFSIHTNSSAKVNMGTGYEDFIFNGIPQNGTTGQYRHEIHKEVIKVLKKYGIFNRGKKTNNFHVLRESRGPAVLVETLFINNENDQKLLKNENYIVDISRAYAVGIANALKLPKKPAAEPIEKPIEKPITEDPELGQEIEQIKDEKIKLNIQGSYKEISGIFYNNKNYISAREILELLGFTVSWDQENKTIIVKK